jgi:hypothetical protein
MAMEQPAISHVSNRVDELGERVGRLETRMDARFNAVDATLHGIQRAMIVTLASILAAFGGLLAAIQF